MNCKNCLSEDLTVLDRKPEYSLIRCNSCFFFFKDVRETNYESLTEKNYIVYNFDRYKEAIEISKIIKKFFKKDSVSILEIGSGTSSLLSCLQIFGYDVTGVEPSKVAVQLSKKVFPNIEVINDYFRANLITKEVDVILLYDVIEHLEPSNKLFEEIYDFMTPNVLLLVKSGNPLSFNARLGFSHWQYVLIDQHISFYSEKALKRFCELKNLRLLKYLKFRHAYGGYHFLKILKNFIKFTLMKFHIDSFLSRDFTIELANDHFIAVIKKNIL